MHFKAFVRRNFPRSTVFYHRVRSMLMRARSGNGSVAIFEVIARENRWEDTESLSGGGSNLRQTEIIRDEIPRLLKKLGAKSLLDAPCGDFNWMRLVDLGDVRYTGADVVAQLIERCNAKFGGDLREFVVRNIVEDKLPAADVILSRDCLVHLSYEHIWRALRNFQASGSLYLLTTTYPSRRQNWDIVTGDWRPLNLEAAPFHFPAPVEAILEKSSEYDGDFADKSLSLWRLDSLPLR